jgi:beta-lactamase superfamily II metal-dependent hydrolase
MGDEGLEMSRRLAIIDVGHGNAAVVSYDNWLAVLDAGPGSSLLQFLTDENITHLDEVFISHADEDHIGGLVAIIASGAFTFGRIRLNSDALKESKIWSDLAVALDDAERHGRIDFIPALTTSQDGEFDHVPVRLEILGPTNFLAMRGPGGADRNGRRITTNSISAVIRLWVNGTPLAVFPGDVDQIGLDEIIAGGVADAQAAILVFPHHGGRAGAGTDPATFAEGLCRVVRPNCVVFSIGRGQFATPDPDVVKTIRRVVADIRIACTQLSEHCAASVPRGVQPHLTGLFARGKERNHCCAGTLVVNFEALADILPSATTHLAFIRASAPTALCRN